MEHEELCATQQTPLVNPPLHLLLLPLLPFVGSAPPSATAMSNCMSPKPFMMTLTWRRWRLRMINVVDLPGILIGQRLRPNNRRWRWIDAGCP